MTIVHVMSKKRLCFTGYKLQFLHAPAEAIQEKRTFPTHKKKKKRIHRQKRRLKRGHTVTIVVNIISSQHFSADSSLNFLVMKFGGRHTSSMLRAEFKLFRISKPKFPRHSEGQLLTTHIFTRAMEMSNYNYAFIF
jgi:hypothetical protein